MGDVRPSNEWPGGRVETLVFDSSVLAGNPWGDPTRRDVHVYLPHDYAESGAPLTVLWDLAAFTNSGPGHLNWRNHGENLPSRLDRLIGSEKMPSVAVVFPDCFTSLGGNQYVNSPGVGRYADYIIDELVPLVEDRFNIRETRDGRGVFGKSSGGYGALYLAMHYPEVWGAAASHAGDAGFEWLYLPEFPTAARCLSEFDGDTEAFIRHFWSKNQPAGADFSTLMVLAMAASYDPPKDGTPGVRLPFDLSTLELDPEAWGRWLAFDPIRQLDDPGCQSALKQLKGLYIDVGFRDQYNSHFGNRRLKARLEALGIDHHYEEFDGTHSGIDWRLDVSLPWLMSRLSD